MENGNFNCRYRKKIIVVDQFGYSRGLAHSHRLSTRYGTFPGGLIVE